MKKDFDFDLYLIGRFQKVSDWAQDWFGINCFDIARFFLYSTIFFLAAYSHFAIIAGDMLSLATSALAMVFCVPTTHSILQYSERSSKTSPVLLNPAIFLFGRLRIFFTFFTLFSLLGLYMIFFSSLQSLANMPDDLVKDIIEYRRIRVASDMSKITLVITLYFCACRPKPPKPGKVKEFFNNMLELIYRIRTPSLRPVNLLINKTRR